MNTIESSINDGWHRSCIRCGYRLDGAQRAGNCTECGMSSTERDVLDCRRRRSAAVVLRIGAVVLGVVTIIRVLLAAIYAWWISEWMIGSWNGGQRVWMDIYSTLAYANQLSLPVLAAGWFVIGERVYRSTVHIGSVRIRPFRIAFLAGVLLLLAASGGAFLGYPWMGSVAWFVLMTAEPLSLLGAVLLLRQVASLTGTRSRALDRLILACYVLWGVSLGSAWGLYFASVPPEETMLALLTVITGTMTVACAAIIVRMWATASALGSDRLQARS